MHNDLTLSVMDHVTSQLGHELQKFKDKTCTSFKMKELKWEFEAQIWNNKKHQPEVELASACTIGLDMHVSAASVTGSTNSSGVLSLQPSTSITSANASVPHGPCQSMPKVKQQLKTLNHNTYKIHALGDYTATI